MSVHVTLRSVQHVVLLLPVASAPSVQAACGKLMHLCPSTLLEFKFSSQHRVRLHYIHSRTANHKKMARYRLYYPTPHAFALTRLT